MDAARELEALEFHYFSMSEEEREAFLRRLRELLAREEHVVFAYVHGSFLSGRPFRDVDVAVWVEDPENAFYYAVELAAELSTSLGLPIDLHVLNKAPLPFKYHVFARGRLLFSRDEEARLREVSLAFRMYFDLRGLLKAPERGPHA